MDNNEEMTSVGETAEEEATTVSTATTSADHSGKLVTLRRCLKAGCHYGHVTKRWNPKMAKFIYGARNGIYLIDLNKTVEQINIAYNALKRIVSDGGKVLFVGTRDNAKELVQQEATRSGSFYISYRWLGGTLTNFSTIFNRIKYLRELNRQMNEGAFEKYSKKELSKLNKKMDKLNKCLSGIVEMRKIPQAIVVCDPTEEIIAVKEAKKLNIPVFAICDTNADPDLITFPIPANDDSNESVKLIISLLGDAIVEARGADAFLFAYQPDEDPEATMKDAVIEADRVHREKLQIINAQRKERQERFEKMQQERFLKNNNGSKTSEKKDEQVKPAAPKKEEKKETKPVEPVKVEPKKEEPKKEEVKKPEPKKEEPEKVEVKKEEPKVEPKKPAKKKEEVEIPHETVKASNIKIEDIAKKTSEEIEDAVKSQFGVDITKLGIKENQYNIFYVTLKGDWRVLMTKVEPFKYFESQGDALLFAQALVNKFKGVIKCQNEAHKFVTASSLSDLLEKLQKKPAKEGK